MLDARSQQIASAPHDAVHRVPLFQKQFAQIGAVLTGDPGNQRDFVGIVHTSRVSLATFAFCFLALVFKRIYWDQGFHQGAAIK